MIDPAVITKNRIHSCERRGDMWCEVHQSFWPSGDHCYLFLDFLDLAEAVDQAWREELNLEGL